MSHTEKVTDMFGEFTEITEDEALAAARATGDPCAFKVIEDEWSDDGQTRIIRKAEIVAISLDSA